MATTAVPRRPEFGGPARIPTTRIPLQRCRTQRTHRARVGDGVLGRTDAYFGRQDTWLARGLARVSPSSGPAYATSGVKRTLDLAVTIPLTVIAILLIGLLLLMNRLLYPRHPVLFLQDRVGTGNESLRVIKIRSMVPRSGSDGAEQDPPGCTAFGRIMRQHYLDELPQLLQALTGQLSLVGIRVLPREVYDSLRISWSGERFEMWQAMYGRAPLGLTGVHQVFRQTGKEDKRRFHHDMFYARHASLGFDLYLLWRTIGTTDDEHSHGTQTPQSMKFSPRVNTM